MEWFTRLNDAMTYIEQHLIEDIDYEQVALIAGCPAYYFQKMFSYMTGISLQEYIRRRRMSNAAIELITSDIKILDLALNYGYESPTAFNRAFQSVHKAAPSSIRRKTASIHAYPPIHFSMNISGIEPLAYHIEDKEAFSLIGITCPFSRNLEENFINIPKQWDRALQDGTLDQLKLKNDQSPHALLGVSIHHQDDWRYMIAVASTTKDICEEIQQYQIPKASWAVFQGQGSNLSLQDLERRVIMEWLPASGYRYADIPDIEVYLKADPQDMIFEYWLPVIK